MEDLGFVVRVRALNEAGKRVGQETAERAAELEARFVERGIDVDHLMARRDEIRQLREKHASAVVDDLEGASVSMAGYLLPLDYSDRSATEFLLVPRVGTCIHTPPPPPNQIVHVVLDEGLSIESRTMYEPLSVAGVLSTRRSTQNVFLKDGSSDINIGYRLQASRVEDYTN
jgi:hypothetical protein